MLQAPEAAAHDVATLLQQAVGHHQAGRLPEAEQLYRAILQQAPNHPDAHHNLGQLARQVGQPRAGLPHLKAAVEANPGQGQYWISFIAALMECKEWEAARQVLAQGRNLGLSGSAVDDLEARLVHTLTSTHTHTHTAKIPRQLQHLMLSAISILPSPCARAANLPKPLRG